MARNTARQGAFAAAFQDKPKAAEERRRRKFIRKAKKAKRAWFIKSLRCHKAVRLKKGMASKGMEVVAWLILGAGTVAASGYIAFYTGKKQVFGTEAKLDLKAEEWEKERDEPEHFGSAVGDDGWEQEFFGIHIRFQEGQITIFRENEKIIQERDDGIH